MYTTLKHNVLQKYLNPYFVETGTSYGGGLTVAVQFDFEKIFSIEINKELQESNIVNFQNYIQTNRMELLIGDSLLELQKLIPSLDKPTTFWLDAHVDAGPVGIKLCPILEELDAIKTSLIKNHTILIDDMRCFGTHWGTGITIDMLLEKIKEINPNYKILYEDGHTPSDILVACV
jgi:hypothetical protein